MTVHYNVEATLADLRRMIERKNPVEQHSNCRKACARAVDLHVAFARLQLEEANRGTHRVDILLAGAQAFASFVKNVVGDPGPAEAEIVRNLLLMQMGLYLHSVFSGEAERLCGPVSVIREQGGHA